MTTKVLSTKSGRHTYGLDRFFSGILGKPVRSTAIFALSLIDVQERHSDPAMVGQVVRAQAKKEVAEPE
jgi:putative transposase